MTQVNRITGGPSEFVKLLSDIRARVASLETRGTGPIFVSDQIITEDPTTGVETIFGALPDGGHGLQQWVNDITPPEKPSSPTVLGERSIFEITWNGLDHNGLPQPPDYARTIVEMSDMETGGVWSEVNYFTAAGRVVIGNQPNNEIRYFRLVSVDANGNRSVPSDISSATLIPYMESAEMTTWISGVEQSVTDAETAASSAQQSATDAQTAADAALTELINVAPYGDLETSAIDSLFESTSYTLESNWANSHSKARYAQTTVSDTTDKGIVLPDIPVQEGRTYRVSFWMWADQDITGNAGMPMMWMLSNGSQYNNASYWGAYTRSDRTNQTIGSWFKVEEDIVAPVGATHIRPRFYVWKLSALAGTIVRFDDFKIIDVTEALAAQQTADAAALTAEDAATAAGLAQTAANGKNTVWYLATAPAGTSHKENDLWFDTTNGNHPMVWDVDTLNWISARDGAIADVDERVDQVVTSVNGKNKNTTSTLVAPTVYEGVAGDIWWQKSTVSPFPIIKQSRWDGSAWVEETFSHQTIASLDLGKATVGQLDGGLIRAGTITADRLSVGPSENSITDSGFINVEIGTNRVSRSTGTWSRGLAAADSTYYYEKSTSTGSVTWHFYPLSGSTYTMSGMIPTGPNTQWTFRAEVNSDGGSAQFGVIYINRDGTTGTSLIGSATTAGFSRRTITGDWTAPSTAMGFQPYIQFENGATSRRSFVYGGASARPKMGTVHIENGAITADKILTGTITAASGVIGSIDASVITVGEMSASRIKAGTISADKLVVGQGENLIVEPNFPAPVVGTTNTGMNVTQARLNTGLQGPVTWFSPNRIGWDKTVSSSTQHALRLSNSTTNPTDATIPVIPGRTYVVAWQVYSDVSSATIGTRAAVLWRKEDGTTTYVAGTPSTYTLISSTGLNAEVRNQFVAPADATHMRVDLQTNGHHGQGRLDFLRPSVRLMTDGTVITDNAVVAKHIMADTITGAKLDVTSVQSRIITSDLFQGKTFTGGTFDQATFQTSSLANTGSKMSPTLGFVSYDTGGNTVFQVDPSGNAVFKGTLQVGSTVPAGAVTGLSDAKIAGYDESTAKVDYWTSPDDVTLIDGGTIATSSITADKIILGSTQNLVPGGDGGDPTGWIDTSSGFVHVDDSAFTTTPLEAPGAYQLSQATTVVGQSPIFNVSALSNFELRYHYTMWTTAVNHRIQIYFYDASNSIVPGSTITIDSTSSTNSINTWYSAIRSNLVAPPGAKNARLVFSIPTPATTYTISFTMIGIYSGAESQLTASGFSSFKSGIQTVRLNGENNMVVGEFVTGIAGTSPYTRLSNRGDITAIDMWGPTNIQRHGGLWWEDTGTNGILSAFAITTNNLDINSDGGYKLKSSGYIELYGRLGIESQTIKTGRAAKFTNIGAYESSTTAHYVTNISVPFDVPYSSGVIPQIYMQATTTNVSEIIISIGSVSNTGFTFSAANHAPRDTGTTWFTYMAVKHSSNHRW